MEMEKIKAKHEEDLKQRARERLAVEKCKNFMKAFWELDAKLRDNPEAQREHAKTLW